MRLPLFLAGLLCTLGSTAQKTQKFYDFQWNEADIAHARFTAVTELTDSGWHRRSSTHPHGNPPWTTTGGSDPKPINPSSLSNLTRAATGRPAEGPS